MRSGVPEFDQPLGKSNLRSYTSDRASIDALLQRIDEAVHQSYERGRVSLPNIEGEHWSWVRFRALQPGVVLQDGD